MQDENNMVQRQCYIDFLKKVLSGIKMKNTTGISDAEVKEKYEDIKNQFCIIKKDKLTEDLGNFLSKVLGDTPQELQELFHFLYDITKDQWFISWQIDVILQQLLHNNDNFYLILQLWKQKTIYDFRLNRRWNGRQEWNMNQYFQTEMQKLLEMQYSEIPVSERNHDFVVIVTTQLVSIAHAPTRLLLKFCRIIEVYLKIKVLIVCAMESINTDRLKKLGLDFVNEMVHLDISGFFHMEYQGRKYKCYQIFLDDTTMEEQRKLMNMIYERKPLFVWQFAGIPTYASAMHQFTSYYYMQMNQGYPAVLADLVINYFQDSYECHPDGFNLLQEKGVPVTDMIFSFLSQPSKGLLNRSQYQIPENGFCLGVAGNRLEVECTDEFVRILARVLEKEKDIQIIFIGFVSQIFIEKMKKILNAEDRCFFLGNQRNPEEALALIDLYVDLPHQGGGYMGTLALSEAKPVLCLKGGDVSAKAGEEFCCYSLEEYENEIIRYKNDEEYYEKKRVAARNRADSIMLSDEKLAELIHKTIKSGIKENE